MWGRGCRTGVRGREEGVKRLSQWKLTTWGELEESWSGIDWEGWLFWCWDVGRAFRENEVNWTAQSRAGRALRRPCGPAPTAPLPHHPALACWPQRPAGRGRAAVGSPRRAHCGQRSPPRGTICSLSMHHLLVWAVTGATGRGGLRSVRLGPGCCRAAGARAGPGSPQPLDWSGPRSPTPQGPSDHRGRSPLAAAPLALQNTGASSTRRGVRRRSKKQKAQSFQPTWRSTTLTLASTWSCMDQDRGAGRSARCPLRELAGSVRSQGAQGCAVLSAPQSLGNYSAVSIAGRNSRLQPAIQVTDNF